MRPGNKKVLVVGPRGFLASYVCSRLLRQPNIFIVGLVRTENELLNVNIQYTNIDILKTQHSFFDEIYLLASFIPYNEFNIPNIRFAKTNIELVLRLSFAYPDSKIIFSSSVSVYGSPSKLPISITSAFEDPSLYGLSKLAAEAIIKNHKRHAIIRFSSIIGSGMSALTMIPIMIASAKTGKIKVLGDGCRLQNYIDVRDAAAMCISAGNEEDNLTALGVGERSYSNIEVAALIQKEIEADIEFIGSDNSPSFVFDTSGSYQILNFTPQYSIAGSVKSIIGT